MPTVLVTGANGFVGQYLIENLLLHNFHVIATGKGGSRLRTTHPNLTYESMDFTIQDEVTNIFKSYEPGVVVHTGALSKPDECEQNKKGAFDVNVAGTSILLNAAERYGSHFIFLSTDFIFSGARGMYKEEDEAVPVNYYGETKLLAEHAVRGYPFLFTIVRTVLVYGHPGGGRDNILTLVASKLRKGEELKIFNDQVRTPTFVGDLAKAIVSIIQLKARGIFHISGEDVLTPFQMACAVARFLSLDERLIRPVDEANFAQPARRPLRTGLDISKSKKILGFKPTFFTDGLKRTFE